MEWIQYSRGIPFQSANRILGYELCWKESIHFVWTLIFSVGIKIFVFRVNFNFFFNHWIKQKIAAGNFKKISNCWTEFYLNFNFEAVAIIQRELKFSIVIKTTLQGEFFVSLPFHYFFRNGVPPVRFTIEIKRSFAKYSAIQLKIRIYSLLCLSDTFLIGLKYYRYLGIPVCMRERMNWVLTGTNVTIEWEAMFFWSHRKWRIHLSTFQENSTNCGFQFYRNFLGQIDLYFI